MDINMSIYILQRIQIIVAEQSKRLAYNGCKKPIYKEERMKRKLFVMLALSCLLAVVSFLPVSLSAQQRDVRGCWMLGGCACGSIPIDCVCRLP